MIAGRENIGTLCHGLENENVDKHVLVAMLDYLL